MANGSCNYNSITPMRVAQYMLQNPGTGSEWRSHVPALIQFVEDKPVKHTLHCDIAPPSSKWCQNLNLR